MSPGPDHARQDERNPAAEPAATSGAAPSSESTAPTPAAQLLGVQRSAGNAAASRLVARGPGAAGGGSGAAVLARDPTAAPPASTTSSITPDLVKTYDDQKLAAELRALDAKAGSVTDPAERKQLEDNLKVLVDEQKRRAAESGKPRLVDTGLARPPGLPADAGFQLVPVEGAPAAVTDKMPEGQLMELVPGVGLRPVGAGGGPPAMPGPALPGPAAPVIPAGPMSIPATPPPGAQPAQVAGAGSFGAIAGGNAIVTTQGFAAAGENALGIIAIPQIRNTLGPTANPVIDVARPATQLGHTAMYLRQNGQIQWVRGFGPDFTVDFLKNVTAVGEGHATTPGTVANDLSLFKSTMAKTVEYPIDAAMAEQVSGSHPLGKGGGAPENWTGKPNVYAHEHGGPAMMCANKNCVMYAVESVEGHLGGPVGPKGSVVNIPSSGVPEGVSPQGTASQGKLYGAMADAESGAAPFARPPGAIGPAVAGSMPQALRYIKWGGRVFIVVGLAAGVWEIASAAPDQRKRTATGVVAGTAGGFAGGAAGGALAGATAGLVCGPGAPVCSLVFGISAGLVGGVIGALGSRALAETAYDLSNPKGTPTSGPLPAVVGKPSTECPSCHSELKKSEAGKSPFPPLGSSSTLASAMISGQGKEKQHTLTEAEIQLVAKYLNLPIDGKK